MIAYDDSRQIQKAATKIKDRMNHIIDRVRAHIADELSLKDILSERQSQMAKSGIQTERIR